MSSESKGKRKCDLSTSEEPATRVSFIVCLPSYVIDRQLPEDQERSTSIQNDVLSVEHIV
jgi:hypothetical protein